MWKESNPENELDYFYIPQYNELHKTGAEEALISNAEEYFARLPRDYQLYDRDEIEQLERPVIGEPQIAALNELHNIFQNEGTDFLGRMRLQTTWIIIMSVHIIGLNCVVNF